MYIKLCKLSFSILVTKHNIKIDFKVKKTNFPKNYLKNVKIVHFIKITENIIIFRTHVFGVIR